MSIPPLISMFLQYSYNLIDSAFVARLSENALTAVSLSFPITTLMNAASIWIGVGVNVLIAGYLGQKKQDEANTTVTHGLLLAFGIGALLNLLSLLIMKPYFRAFTNNEEIYQLSIAYMSVCSFMQIPNMVHIAIQKMIQATGNMVAPMWFQIAGVVVNFALNPILIFGVGIFPTMGIRGSAVATVAGYLLSMILAFVLLLGKKQSEEAMTALSLVYPVQNFINAVGIGFGVGINAVIAFHLGAGDNSKADQAATQGLVFAIIHGVVMTVCCIAIMPVFLRMFTSSEAVIELGVRYSIVAFAFTLIVTVSMAFEKLFQAVGNMKTTMISLMCGCITNIVLDPVLIFGYGPFPEMGIEGAALATGIGQALTLAIYLVVYLLRPIRVHIRRQYILPRKKMVIKLYSIGIPATLNLALPSLLISALNAILAAYSEVYILVLGIYYKLQTFIYLPANGIVQGMRPLIGYNYGAGEHKRVSQ